MIVTAGMRRRTGRGADRLPGRGRVTRETHATAGAHKSP
jgi:hypothetical protein